MAGKFELYKDNAGEFRFRLKAANGQNILSSEGYSSRSAAENGIKSVQSNCGDDECFERKQSSGGKHYFVLKARNHQVIGQSQMYDSAESMEGGIASVRNNGSTGNVDDQTA